MVQKKPPAGDNLGIEHRIIKLMRLRTASARRYYPFHAASISSLPNIRDRSLFMSNTINPERMELSAKNMGHLATRLEQAVGLFDAWGIRLSNSGRLAESVRLLRAVHMAGVFPRDHTKLIRVSHAVRDAQEFVEIGDSLPQDALRPLALDLQKAVTGTLGVGGTKAMQFQSQLWIGAMLAHADVTVSVILNGTNQQPDFVVENGTLRYAVEVKRPHGNLKAEKLVSEAATQLRGQHYHGGAIVVDLTDCIDPSLTVTVGSGPPPSDTELKSHATLLTDKLSGKIFDYDRKRMRHNRDHIFSLITTGRSFYGDVNDLSCIYLFRFTYYVTFWGRHPSTLRGVRARWLTKLIQHGMRSAGYLELHTAPVIP